MTDTPMPFHPIYNWVEVKVKADATAAEIEQAVEHSLANDGDVPIHAVGDFRRTVLAIGSLRSAVQFVRIYKEVRSV